jgi:CBS domain-containing protein
VKQIMTGAPAHKSSSHPRAAAATVDDGRAVRSRGRLPDEARGHGSPDRHRCPYRSAGGIITQADVTRAIADGKDVNDVRVYAVMTTRPAVITTASIRDAATIMTARHLHHLPVADDAGPPRNGRHDRRVPSTGQRRRG